MSREPEASPPSPHRRRPRRADAGPARPGAETTAPAAPTPTPAAVAPADADAGLLPPRAAEDTGRAWGDWRDDGDSNDERLLRDRPPHWG